jgi:hypothetical protein
MIFRSKKNEKKMIAANTVVYGIKDATLAGRITSIVISICFVASVVFFLKRK